MVYLCLNTEQAGADLAAGEEQMNDIKSTIEAQEQEITDLRKEISDVKVCIPAAFTSNLFLFMFYLFIYWFIYLFFIYPFFFFFFLSPSR